MPICDVKTMGSNFKHKILPIKDEGNKSAEFRANGGGYVKNQKVCKDEHKNCTFQVELRVEASLT